MFIKYLAWSVYQEVVVVVFASFREKELAAVKINAAEVDIIASELEVKLTFFAMFLMFNADITAYLIHPRICCCNVYSWTRRLSRQPCESTKATRLLLYAIYCADLCILHYFKVYGVNFSENHRTIGFVAEMHFVCFTFFPLF